MARHPRCPRGWRRDLATGVAGVRRRTGPKSWAVAAEGPGVRPPGVTVSGQIRAQGVPTAAAMADRPLSANESGSWERSGPSDGPLRAPIVHCEEHIGAEGVPGGCSEGRSFTVSDRPALGIAPRARAVTRAGEGGLSGKVRAQRGAAGDGRAGGQGTTRWTGLPMTETCHVVVSLPPTTLYSICHQPLFHRPPVATLP